MTTFLRGKWVTRRCPTARCSCYTSVYWHDLESLRSQALGRVLSDAKIMLARRHLLENLNDVEFPNNHCD